MIVFSVAASVFAAFGAATAVRAFATNAAKGQTGQANAGDTAIVPVAAVCHFQDGSFKGQMFDAYYGARSRCRRT
jgi:hypothetical protein